MRWPWLLAALMAGYGAPVAAETVTVTFDGTITSGIDTAGLFGAPDTDLAGAAYSVAYSFDSTLGARQDYPAYGFFGGYGLGIPSPGMGAAVTINGQSVSLSGFDLFSDLQENTAYDPDTGLTGCFFSVADQGQYAILSSAVNFETPAPLPDGPMALAVPASAHISQTFLTIGSDPRFSANVTGFSTTVSPPLADPLPEPASWALMLLGGGAAGCAMRMRRYQACPLH